MTAHDVNVKIIQIHIFPEFFFYAETGQYGNVRQAVVCKRRGFTSVVERTASLSDCLFGCFATNV